MRFGMDNSTSTVPSFNLCTLLTVTAGLTTGPDALDVEGEAPLCEEQPQLMNASGRSKSTAANLGFMMLGFSLQMML